MATHWRLTCKVCSICSSPPEAALMTPPAMGTPSPTACAMGNTVWATFVNFALREVDGPGTTLSVRESMDAEIPPRSHGD